MMYAGEPLRDRVVDVAGQPLAAPAATPASCESWATSAWLARSWAISSARSSLWRCTPSSQMPTITENTATTTAIGSGPRSTSTGSTPPISWRIGSSALSATTATAARGTESVMNASGHSAKRTNENTSTSTIPAAYSNRTPAWKTIPRTVRSSVAASRRPYARYQSASPTSAATAPQPPRR